MKVLKIFRPLDFVMLALFLAVAAASLFVLRIQADDKAFLLVNTPEGEFVYPLHENRELHLKGLLGDSLVVIQDGRAFFRESPCPNKICVQTRAVEHANDWAACLPNQVIIHVETSGKKDEPDATVR